MAFTGSRSTRHINPSTKLRRRRGIQGLLTRPPPARSRAGSPRPSTSRTSPAPPSCSAAPAKADGQASASLPRALAPPWVNARASAGSMAARPRAQGPWANRQAPRLLHAWPARARAWCRAARGRGGAQVGTRAEEGAGTGGSEDGQMVERRAPLARADKPGDDVMVVRVGGHPLGGDGLHTVSEAAGVRGTP